MKNILILEDDLERMKSFENNLSGHKVVHVETANEAVALLDVYDWDCIFLDHDLGGETMVDSFTVKNTGYAVAAWLEKHPDRRPSVVIIHSFNPIGSRRMQQALPEAVQLPGAWNFTLEQIEEGARVHVLEIN